MDLKELESVTAGAASHWYYQSKALALQNLIQGLSVKSVLDVGSGSGFFSKYLLKNTAIQEAYCIDIGYERDWDELCFDKPIHYRKHISTNSADLVLMMDVLEHVDDDVALLKDYVGLSPAGTYFLITVPAFKFLWSAHDEYLEHKRRYTLEQLEAVVMSSGLTTQIGVYFFGLVFPLAVITRLTQRLVFRGRAPISQLDSHSLFINTFLKWICKLEISLMRLNKFAGLSVCVLAKKTT